MKNSANYLATSILVLLQASCASMAGEEISLERRLFDMGVARGETVQRLSSYRINGWRSIDEENLIITIGVNDEYLVTLRSPCFDLRNAFFIGFTTTAGSLDQFESIVVEGPGSRREFCPIKDIFEVDDITPAEE